MKELISSATMQNWKKLKIDMPKEKEKLVSRANKRLSKKRIFPVEYMTNKENASDIIKFIDLVTQRKYCIKEVIYSLAVKLLSEAGQIQNPLIKELISSEDIKIIDEIIEYDIPKDEHDIIGIIYQVLRLEGEKNISGAYYTPINVVKKMTKDFKLSGSEKILDPCCGTLVFHLNIDGIKPEQIYALDKDPIAVFIAKTNYYLKFNNTDVKAKIFCGNFIDNEEFEFEIEREIFLNSFDYIITNPPWGAMSDTKAYSFSEISSSETFSYFFLKAFSLLETGGYLSFLLPEAVLNVKTHRDLRSFILEKTNLIKISQYTTSFSGVLTKYVDITVRNEVRKNTMVWSDGENSRVLSKEQFLRTKNLIFKALDNTDITIFNKVKTREKQSLKNSLFAIGIVTGNNNEKLSNIEKNGWEKIYTGKEIEPYVLQKANKFIVYDRKELQQVAKDEIYRNPEKLVYKFISRKLSFALDESGSLFLNSANILIPDVEGLSIKSVMGFLNSELYQYLYITLFGEIKILKGNLIELPFPKLSKDEDNKLTELVDRVIKGIDSDKYAQQFIYKYFGISNYEKEHIKRSLEI